MYAPDQDISDVPYHILIRARTESQFNQAVLAISSRVAATMLSARASKELAPALTKAMANISLHEPRENREPSADSVLTALHALADLDDWCGTPPRPPRWPWPWPWPWRIDDKLDPDPVPWRELGYSDIIALKTITNLATLMPSEVGKDLAEISHSMIKEMAG